MHDGMSSRDPGNPAMEAIVCGEGPSGEPQKGVVACCKYPDHGKLGD